MAKTTTLAGLICWTFLGVFALGALYFTSYFAAWSLSARTRVSPATFRNKLLT
jgi:hypothetical protein